MQRRNLLVLGALAVGAFAFIGLKYFAPKGSTDVDHEAPADHAERLAGGQFSGADAAHHVEGTVTVVRDGDDALLRFEGYDATNGPDVYFYISPDREGEYNEAATKILVPGGAEDGQATLRGNFNVPLPADIDPETIGSVIVWCKRFSVTFGTAAVGSDA